MIAGFDNGNIGDIVINAVPSGFMTFGLSITSISDTIKPTAIPVMAPCVLNLFQNIVNTMTGKLALAATQNANDTKNATFKF